MLWFPWLPESVVGLIRQDFISAIYDIEPVGLGIIDVFLHETAEA